MLFTQKVGKRVISIVLSLICLLGIAVPALAAEAPVDEDTSYTCLVYYSASPGSMVIGRLEDGTKLTVLEESSDFYKIDCYDMNGYIAKEQVRSEADGEYYVSCNPESEETVQTQYVSLADALTLRADVLALADEQLGTPYVMGGTAPGGFDCSGFASYVFKNNGFAIRRTVTQQLQDTIIIPRESLQAGDLVFFSDGSSFTSHVGIYVGNNQIIHAGNAGIGYADLDLSYFTNCYLCCRRIINVDTSSTQQLPSAAAQSVSASLTGNGLRTAS